jgi:GNAT superfamily N-acetyltransferase
MFRMCKAIDGYDEENTFILTSMRVDAFHAHPSRHPYYELTTSYDDLRDALYLNWRLEEMGVPPTAWRRTSVGIPFYPSGFRASDGRLVLPAPCEPEVGGHCVGLSGWDEGGEVLTFMNTWGPDWGDEGSGSLTREYLETLMREAWIYFDARLGPTPEKNDPFISAVENGDEREAARIWSAPNRRFRVWHRHRGVRVRLVVFDTISLRDRMVEVIEIRSRRNVLMAWAHIHFEGGDPRTVRVKEFYVWPTFRRQGFGTLLAELVAERAAGWSRISATIYQPDILPGFRPGVEEFVRKLGYSWRWTLCERPLLVAVAEREV